MKYSIDGNLIDLYYLQYKADGRSLQPATCLNLWSLVWGPLIAEHRCVSPSLNQIIPEFLISVLGDIGIIFVKSIVLILEIPETEQRS